MNVNKAILVGRITNDLELKSTPTGREVLSFGLATNRTWKDQSGAKQEKTDFHNVVVWGKQAATVAQYCMKGQELYVEGRLETRSWDDQETGKKNYRTEVVMERFEFGQRPNGASAPQSNNNYNQSQNNNSESSNNDDSGDFQYPDEEINPEDIPF
tara:strand:+ start:55 stop:522 length:468 start_codon:yes stop_codon:yes gene_type:complete